MSDSKHLDSKHTQKQPDRFHISQQALNEAKQNGRTAAQQIEWNRRVALSKPENASIRKKMEDDELELAQEIAKSSFGKSVAVMRGPSQTVTSIRTVEIPETVVYPGAITCTVGNETLLFASGRWLNLFTDSLNCGCVGTACPSGYRCVDGCCVPYAQALLPNSTVSESKSSVACW